MERTFIGCNLPVYSDIHRQGPRIDTLIRGIWGDINVSLVSSLTTNQLTIILKALKNDLVAELKLNKKLVIVRGDLQTIRIRNGNYNLDVRRFLTKRGF